MLEKLSPRWRTFICELLKFLISAAIGAGICGCVKARYQDDRRSFEFETTIQKPQSQPAGQ